MERLAGMARDQRHPPRVGGAAAGVWVGEVAALEAVRAVMAGSAQPRQVVAGVVTPLTPKNFVVKLNTGPLLATFTRLTY